MKKLLFAVGVAVLVIPMFRPIHAQDGVGGFGADSIDLSSILGNDNRGSGNRGPQIPNSKQMFADIKDILKKGKTPLEKAQEKPLQSLLDKDVVELTDRIQLLQINNSNAPAPRGQGRGGRGANTGGAPAANTQQTSEQAIKVDTITTLKNDDFIETKIALFLTPEQTALIKKAHADDKSNATCLGGLLDRYYNQLQNPNRGTSNNTNQDLNRGNNNSNAKRPNGQAYCMTMEATPSDRLEPIRKVLAKGNMPLAKDKDMIAEVFMKSQLQDLEAAFRSGLGNTNIDPNLNRGNSNISRNNDPRLIIQSATDNMYKHVETFLNPPQAETLKKWHYGQMLGRGGIETLVAIEALQDTPLTDAQLAKVTAAWPELRSQIQAQARAANKPITDKTLDAAAMEKILAMLEPAQEASYRLAVKYGPQAAAGK